MRISKLKRIALLVVFPILSGLVVPISAHAALPGTTITLSSASVNAWVGESATVTATVDFSTSAATDSVTVYTTVSSSTGVTQEIARLVATTDSANVTQNNRLETRSGKYGYSDTITVTGASAKASYNLNLYQIVSQGVYTVTFVVADKVNSSVINSSSYTVYASNRGSTPTTSLSLSATSISGTVGETSSVTASIALTGSSYVDSIAVFTTLAKPSSSSQGLAELRATTDSANVTQANHLDFIKSQKVGYSDTVTIVAGGVGSTAKATYQVNLVNIDVAGTYTLNVIVSDAAKTSIYSNRTVTITVAAENVLPSATYSWAQIVGGTTSVKPDGTADSAVVAAPGTVGATGSVVASIWVYQYNSDSSVVTARGTRVGESVTATLVSGPGQLSLNGSTSGALTVTAGPGDTITVLSDGRSGTASIRLGTTTLGSSWVTKTVTFFGEMTQLTATLPNSTANNTVALSAGTATLKVYPKDKDGNIVTSDAKHGIYVYSSDTYVVSNYGKCTYTVAGGYVSCSLTLVDSGTVTLTVRDSATATAAFSVTTGTLTVAGAAYKGTITTDKTTYAPGEAMKFTITSKDRYDRIVADGTSTPFGTTYFAGATPTFGVDNSANAAGGKLDTASGSLVTYLSTYTSFLSGTDTVMAFAPTTGGTYTLKGTLNGLADQTLLTFTVADPTKDAADAATDAALEATDAAYAAQDAAQLAAEAADAATAAAEAATAAVEDLATQVAALFADLQKQITTLANVVAKIAKKVKA